MDMITKNPKVFHNPATIPAHLSRAILGGILFFAGVGVSYAVLTWTRSLEAKAPPAEKKADAGSAEESNIVKLDKAKWSAAGIKIEPVTTAPLTERIWRTGKISLDQNRLANITPLFEGVVREVKVQLGQMVPAGAVLAILDSKELGQAKLDLVKNRLGLAYAEHEKEWLTTISKNAQYLLDALVKNMPVAEIEKQLRGRPIGEWRQKLMTAYTRREQHQNAYKKLIPLHQEGGVSEAAFRQARADAEAAENTYQGFWEDIRHESHHQLHQAEQKFREADTALTITKAHLMMMGFSKKDIDGMDPVAEAEKVSLYAIRAPFAGTIIARYAKLSERIGPQAPAFQIADLNKVWVEADIPEADMDFVQGLDGRKLRFKAAGRPGPLAEAVVFYPGDLVDKETRTIKVRAVASNPGRRLKPGMFVDVELSKGEGTPVMQVPAAAIQRLDKTTFVFLHQGGEEFRRVDVSLGRESGNHVEITAGLEAGQAVVVQGAFALKSEMLRALLKEE